MLLHDIYVNIRYFLCCSNCLKFCHWQPLQNCLCPLDMTSLVFEHSLDLISGTTYFGYILCFFCSKLRTGHFPKEPCCF